MEKDKTSVILAGMSCRRHLAENIKIVASPPLAVEEMTKLDTVMEEKTDWLE